MSQTPNEFYAERGLIRSSITLDEKTIAFLGEKSKELSVSETKVTQGDIVIVLAQLLKEDQSVQALFEKHMTAYVDTKARERNELKEKRRKAKKLLMSGALDDLLDKDK